MKIDRRKNGGFTLVELIVVMVIVGILAIISVPMYTNYVTRARSQEGVALAGAVLQAVRLHGVEHGNYNNLDPTRLGINPQTNKFFRNFGINSPDTANSNIHGVVLGSGAMDGINVYFIHRIQSNEEARISVWDSNNNELVSGEHAPSAGQLAQPGYSYFDE